MAAQALAAAAAAATEVWQGIMVVEVVVGGNGGQPCRALQRLELERYMQHSVISSEPLISLSFPPTNKNKLAEPKSFHSFPYLHILFFFLRLMF